MALPSFTFNHKGGKNIKPLGLNNGKTDCYKLAEQLNDLLGSHHVFLSYYVLNLKLAIKHWKGNTKGNITKPLSTTIVRSREHRTNPNSSSSFLTSFKKLSNVPPHLLDTKLFAVPQQLYSRNCKFQQCFTEEKKKGIPIKIYINPSHTQIV